MRRRSQQSSMTRLREVNALRDRESADEQWRDAEHTAPPLDAAARALVEQAGSRERAKHAVDAIEEGHPP